MNRTMTNTPANMQHRLMKQIQSYGFAVNEAILYLDTHPTDRAALAYYDKTRRLLRDAMNVYEQKYGPLTAYDVQTENGWTWTEQPWPWEYEFSGR